MEKKIMIFNAKDFFRPGESVYIHRSQHFPRFIGKPHKHRFIELVYILSGSAVHTVGDNRYPVKKGDIIIINYDTPHCFSVVGDGFDAYDLMFTPDFFDASAIASGSFDSLASSFLFFSLFPAEAPLGSDLHLSPQTSADFDMLFNRIYTEYTEKDMGYIEIIRAYVIELIISIFRCLSRDAAHTISEKQRLLVIRAVEYMKENYDSPLSIGDLAARTFLSKDYFSHLFKDVTGMSFSSFLQKTRIEDACRKLCETDRTVADIAFSCGFNDMKFFYTCFKKYTGTTPSKYKESHERIL